MRDNDFETKTSKLWAKDKTKSQQIHYLIWISSWTFPLLASHGGVFRGARFSSLPTGMETSSPKNACVGGYSSPWPSYGELIGRGAGGGGAVHRLTFASVDEILWCYHSNETSSAVLSHGTIYLVCSSTFEVFRWKSFGVTIDKKPLKQNCHTVLFKY